MCIRDSVCTQRERSVERGESAFRLPELTAHQLTALNALREQFAAGKTTALLQGVTGSGKKMCIRDRNGKCACVSRPARTSLRRNPLRDSRRRLAASVRLVLCEVRNPPACGPGRPVPAPNPRSSAGRS